MAKVDVLTPPNTKKLFKKIIPKGIWRRLRILRNLLAGPRWYLRGSRVARDWLSIDYSGHPNRALQDNADENRLWTFFENRTDGPGIWKWKHYFPAYDRHFRKFVGDKPTVMEIGVFSGGSLDMWLDYFGEGCRVYGVDLAEECRAYERESVEILIGDQADREFWDMAKSRIPGGIDVLVDDGGHTPRQQMTTLECMLPHINPGGVYLCEDVEGTHNRFASYAAGLVNEMNRARWEGDAFSEQPSEFQRQMFSVHFYPFMVIIEKRAAPLVRLEDSQHGSSWQPFLVRDGKPLAKALQ